MITLTDLFPDTFVNALLVLLGLIVLDLVFGVAVAIKRKKFDFKQVADFYSTSVIPNILGWAVADIVLRLAQQRLPGSALVDTIVSLGTTTLYGLVVIALGAQIAGKLSELRAPAAPSGGAVTK